MIKVSQLLFIAVCAILVHHSSTPVRAESPDLYSPADNVIRLNATTFIPTVYHQNKNFTYMVQFYNTFCGHCQLFAPIYKDLASRVKNWTSVIRVAGVDCSKDENVITCSENKIEGYPTILLFPPNARIQETSDKPVNLRSLNIEWTVDDIEDTMIDYLANLTNSGREIPLAINAFKPIDVEDLSKIHRLYTPQALGDQHDISSVHHGPQDFMIVVETEKSYLGRKLIVEYFRINSKLEVRRVLTSNKALLSKILPAADFRSLEKNQPLLVKLDALMSRSRLADLGQVLVRGEIRDILPTSAEHERIDFIHKRFKTFFEHYYAIELRERDGLYDLPAHQDGHHTASPDGNNEISQGFNDELEIQYLTHQDPVGSKGIFAVDLLKGMVYMLTHEVKVKGDLNPSEFNTIRNLLSIFKKFFPLERWDASVSKFVVDLRTRLDSNRAIYENNGVSSQEMRDLLELSGADPVRLRYGRENWISCYNSDRQHKGYTCSLWLIFHSLTVGEYSKAAPVRVKPTMVLYTMRDYITKFLGCTVCASNFAKETESLEGSLNSRNSSVLWLWNTHNLVNQRLNNEKLDSKRQLFELVFPSPKSCQKCFNAAISEIGVDGKTLNDINWNMNEVIQYLVDTFKPDRVITPIEMASLLASVKSKANYDLIDINTDAANSALRQSSTAGSDLNRSVEQWNIFSTSDISLCLFLYLFCIMILAAVCLAFNPKWKRFKTK